MLIFVSIFLIGIGWFTYTMKHEPRSLWAGVFICDLLLTTAVFIVAILMRYSEFFVCSSVVGLHYYLFSDHSDDMYGIVAVCVSVSLSL